MKSALFAVAAVVAFSGAAFAQGGERPDVEPNQPGARVQRPVAPDRRVEPPRRPPPPVVIDRRPPPPPPPPPTRRWGYERPPIVVVPAPRISYGFTCETPRFECELPRAQPLGDDCWCRSPSGARRSGTVVP